MSALDHVTLMGSLIEVVPLLASYTARLIFAIITVLQTAFACCCVRVVIFPWLARLLHLFTIVGFFIKKILLFTHSTTNFILALQAILLTTLTSLRHIIQISFVANFLTHLICLIDPVTFIAFITQITACTFHTMAHTRYTRIMFISKSTIFTFAR